MCVLFVSYSQPTDLVSYQANLECLSLAKGLGECTDTQEFSQSPKLAVVSCTLSGQWSSLLLLCWFNSHCTLMCVCARVCVVCVHMCGVCLCVCVCVCMYVYIYKIVCVTLCIIHVGDTDGTLRLSRGSTDGANEGTLEIVFNGR